MVDFAAYFTIHAIKISKILHFTWKELSLKVIHLPIACGGGGGEGVWEGGNPSSPLLNETLHLIYLNLDSLLHMQI